MYFLNVQSLALFAHIHSCLKDNCTVKPGILQHAHMDCVNTLNVRIFHRNHLECKTNQIYTMKRPTLCV